MDCLSMMVGAGVFDEERKPLSQEEYFRMARRNFHQAQYRIAFMGYDKPFMDDPQTKDAICTIINSQKVAIQAIFPEALETFMDKHAENPLVTLLKFPLSSAHGFILIDMGCAMYWDTRKPTEYQQERQRGVYYRESIPTQKTAGEWAELFMELERSARVYLSKKKLSQD